MGHNYYKLLELDPRLQDESDVLHHLKCKERQWKYHKGDSPLAVQTAKNLTVLNQMRKALHDAEYRKKQAQEYRHWLKNTENIVMQKLREVISSRLHYGEIFEPELNELLSQPKYRIPHFNDAHDYVLLKVSKSLILDSLGVNLRKDLSYAADASFKNWIHAEPLSIVSMSRMQRALYALRKKDLFDFLQASPCSNLTFLQERTVSLKAKAERGVKASDDEFTIHDFQQVLDLTRLCEDVFSDEASLLNYTKSLDVQKFKGLHGFLKEQLKDLLLDATGYQKVLKKAAQLALSMQKADFFISDYGKNEGLLLQPPNQSFWDTHAQCDNCMEINPSDASFCHSCASPLCFACPRCGYFCDGLLSACPQCSFHPQNMPNALVLIKEAQQCMQQNDFDQAEKLLSRADDFWPAQAELLQVRERLHLQWQHHKETRGVMEQLISEKRFLAARSLLRDWKTNEEDETLVKSYHNAIESKIQMAAGFAMEARMASSTEQRQKCYQRALQECSDYKEALEKV